MQMISHLSIFFLAALKYPRVERRPPIQEETPRFQGGKKRVELGQSYQKHQMDFHVPFCIQSSVQFNLLHRPLFFGLWFCVCVCVGTRLIYFKKREESIQR